MTEISNIKQDSSRPLTKSSKVKSGESQSLQKEDVTTSTNSQPTEKLEGKISKWFAQAGVSSTRYTTLEKDAHKKLDRREYIKRQRKLENLQKVLDKALDFCVDSELSENIDIDWFFSFVDMAESVYSPEMQELWGKIFTVEVSKPGTFSIRTLKTLKELTQRDAHIFRIAVGMAARKKGEFSPKILYGYYQKPSFFSMLSLQKNHQLNLAEFGLAYPDILSLMEAGLIYNAEIESSELSVHRRGEWRIGKHGFHLGPRRGGLFLNYYKFTATGEELSKLVSSLPSEQYWQAIQNLLIPAFELDVFE